MEDYVRNDGGETVKRYAPVLSGSHVFRTVQLKVSIYCKGFLSSYFSLETFFRFIWRSEKIVRILAVTRFFQAKAVSPSNVDNHCCQNSSNPYSKKIWDLVRSQTQMTQWKKVTPRILAWKVETDLKPKLPDYSVNEFYPIFLPIDLLQVVDIITLIKLKRPGKTIPSALQMKKLELSLVNKSIKRKRWKIKQTKNRTYKYLSEWWKINDSRSQYF